MRLLCGVCLTLLGFDLKLHKHSFFLKVIDWEITDGDGKITKSFKKCLESSYWEFLLHCLLSGSKDGRHLLVQIKANFFF